MNTETAFCETCRQSRRVPAGGPADCPEGHGPMRKRGVEPEETDTIKALTEKWEDPYATKV